MLGNIDVMKCLLNHPNNSIDIKHVYIFLEPDTCEDYQKVKLFLSELIKETTPDFFQKDDNGNILEKEIYLIIFQKTVKEY
jgi:hypothetical protein